MGTISNQCPWYASVYTRVKRLCLNIQRDLASSFYGSD